MPRDTGAFGQELDHETEQRIERIVAEMTIEEAVGQMVGTPPLADTDALERELEEYHLGSIHFGGTPYNTPEDKARIANAAQETAIEASRFDIPLFLRAMAEHGHAAIAGSTVFPQQLGLAATRDPALVDRCAAVTARELRATGVQSTSSPIGDVARDARWGRIEETFGESPTLCAELTRAMVEGYQGESEVGGEPVVAVTKHFPAYSEGVRGEDQAPNELTDYTLRRVHLPPHAAGIDAGTGGIMPSYTAIGGEPVHGSRRYLDGLLRDDLGFDGFVLADYAGERDLHGGHHTTGSLRESLREVVRAGVDLLPSGGSEYAEPLVDLVESDELSVERIEASARRVLRAKAALGLFEDPFVDAERAASTLGSDEHRAVAFEAARKSMTLLKNEGDVLPLSDDLDELFVAGPCADDIAAQHGGWGNVADPEPLGDTVLEALRDAAGPDTTVTHEQGAGFDERLDVEGARSAAAAADAAVVVLGEPDYIHEFRASSESFDAEDWPKRTEIGLSPAQLDLAEAVHGTGTPTIAVFVTGRVLATPWIAENVPAILMAYRPGSAGAAVADVLFGAHDPGGVLPVSIPRSAGHLPTRFNHLPYPTRDNPAHVDAYDPLFTYGHGLSYTTFEYRDLDLSDDEIEPDDTIDVTVTLSNVGDRAGSEVVECFVNDVISSRVTPVRKLAGFRRVELDPGERTTVSFALGEETLGVVREDGTRRVEPGTFEVFVADRRAEFDVVGRSHERG